MLSVWLYTLTMLQPAPELIEPAQLTVERQPATHPASQPADQLRRWLADLASDDPAVRRQARQSLLGISRADLLQLRELIAAGAAPQPAQREALFDVVCHVFLATEPYESIPDVSFFGISQYRPVTVGDRAGLAFQGRLIGFPAYASLEEGDIILAVVERPEVDFLGMQPLETVRRGFKPGSTIHLQVLRDDRVLTVPLTLAPSPTWSGRGIEQQSAREQLAAEFWRTRFSPLWSIQEQ